MQSKDEEDNTIFHGCIANYTYGEAFIRSFVESEIDFETFGGAVDNHNIDLAKEVGYLSANMAWGCVVS